MVLVGLSAPGITNTYIWKCTTNEQQIQTPFWRPLVLFPQNRATSHSACITSALISDLSTSCLACRQFFLCCRKHWKHLMDYEQKLQERELSENPTSRKNWKTFELQLSLSVPEVFQCGFNEICLQIITLLLNLHFTHWFSSETRLQLCLRKSKANTQEWGFLNTRVTHPNPKNGCPASRFNGC